MIKQWHPAVQGCHKLLHIVSLLVNAITRVYFNTAKTAGASKKFASQNDLVAARQDPILQLKSTSVGLKKWTRSMQDDETDRLTSLAALISDCEDPKRSFTSHELNRTEVT